MSESTPLSESTPRDRLGAYLDGRLTPDEEAAFEAYAASDDALLEASAEGVTDLLAPLGEVACPPEVLAAARAGIRRAAPDRASRRGGRFRTLRVRVGIVALLAIAASAAVWVATDVEPEVQIADVRPLPEALPPAPLDDAPPLPEADPEPTATDPAPATPVARGARPAPPPRRAVPSRPAPASRTPPEAVAPPPDLAMADSVAAAREEVLLALAIVADAQGQAASAVADGVGRVSDALHSTPTLLSPQTP
ncbi:MAG: hypothetical protein AAF845_16960 [Bacteroidota bacterium]